MKIQIKGNRWKYAIIGGLAGIANGLFGAGGGLFLVPLFIKWTKMEEKKAFATSVAVIFPLSVASLIIFLLYNGSIIKTALPYTVGGILGGIVSGKMFQHISVVWLHRLFGALLLYGGIKILFF